MKYLDKIKTICPQCNTQLLVKNADGLAYKQVKCPKCGQLLKVKFPAAEVTPTDSQPAAEQPTTIVSSAPKTGTYCHLLRTPNGETVRLMVGINTVGRASSQSQATLQLHVDDAYMSRHSAKIELRRLPNSPDRVTLTYWNSKNPISVNGTVMDPQDIIVLHHADRITIGRTIIVYEVRELE